MTNESQSGIPEEFRAAASLLSGELAALMHAELNAGNTMIDAGHTHPAPPAGAYVMFANPISSRTRESFGDVHFYDRDGASYRGEFTDVNRFFFVLEAPRQDASYPDMNAIREKANFQTVTEDSVRASGFESPVARPIPSTPIERFDESRTMDYERWKEGIGYDLEALRSLTAEEQETVVLSLIPANDWRDVEALASLGSARTDRALKEVMDSDSVKMRMAVMRYAPHLVDEAKKLESVLMAVARAESFEGLVETLDMLETYHPPVVIDAMFEALLNRSGDMAYHYATVLAVIYRKLKSRHDWSLRPQLLKFNTTDRNEREDAFLALYDLLKTSREFKSNSAEKLAAELHKERAS